MPRFNLFPVQDQSISNNATIQEVENMYLENNPDPTKSKFILRTRDGSAFASTQVANELVNYEAAGMGSLIGNGNIYALAVTPFDISLPNVIALSNQIYDFFDDAPGTLLKNHITPQAYQWTQTNLATGAATGVYPENAGGIGLLEWPPGSGDQHLTATFSLFGGFVNNNGAIYTLPGTGTNVMNGVTINVISFWSPAGVPIVTRFRDIGNVEYLQPWWVSTSNISGSRTVKWSYIRYENGVLANMVNSTTNTFINSYLTPGNPDNFQVTLNDVWTNLRIHSANIDGGTANYHVNFQSANTTGEWSNYGFRWSNITYSYRTNINVNGTLHSVNQATFSLIDSVNITGADSGVGSGITSEPAKRIMIYEGSNTSNLVIGAIEDGVIAYTTPVVKDTIHTGYSPLELVAGFANIIITGDTANFVVYDSSLKNETVVAKPEFQTGDQGSLAYLGGYYYWNTEKSGRYYASDLEDPTSWPAAKYATAEYAGDSIQYIKAFKDYLWVFGGLTTEIWYQTGNPDFPLGRMPNGVLDIGLIEKAVTQTLDSIYFVGTYKGTSGIYKTEGFNVKKISTPEIDRYIAKRFDSKKPFNRSFFLTSYSQEDHFFVLFNRLGGDQGTPTYPSYDSYGKCYVYDEATGVWHKRTSSRGSGLSGIGYPFTWFINDEPSYKRQGKLGLAAGPKTKGVTEIRLGLTTDEAVDYTSSTNVVTASYDKILTSPHVSGEDRQISFSRVRLDSANTYSNAQVFAWISDNDGVTWSELETQYLDSNYVEWWQLGSAEDRVFKFKTNANVLLYLNGGFADIIGGTHR